MAICCVSADLLHYSLESILAVKLRTDFSYSTSTIGAYFMVFFAGTLIIGVISLFFPEKWDKRILIIIALWINVLAALLIGPSLILHFPNDPLLIKIGLFLGGSTRNITGAYIIVEGIKAGVAKFPDYEVRVGDVISSIYMIGSGITLLSSPVIGSALVQVIGFRHALDLETLIFLISALVYSVSTVWDLREEKMGQISSIQRESGESEQVALIT